VYEIFKTSVNEFFTKDMEERKCRKTQVQDLLGRVVEEKFRIVSGKSHQYTLNMYHTTSSCLINGKQVKNFLDNDLPEIFNRMGNVLRSRGLSFEEVNDELSQILKTAKQSVNEQTQSPVDNKSVIMLRDQVESVRAVRRAESNKESEPPNTDVHKLYEQIKSMTTIIDDLTKENKILKATIADSNAGAMIIEEEMKRLMEKNTQLLANQRLNENKSRNVDDKVLTQIFDAINDLRSRTDLIYQEINTIKCQPKYSSAVKCMEHHHQSPVLPAETNGNIHIEEPRLPATTPKLDKIRKENSTSNQQHQNQSSLTATTPKLDKTGRKENSTSNQQHQNQNSLTAPRKQTRKTTLLLGDSIIQRLNPKGLLTSVHKHAIPGGTIKDVLNDIHSFNLCHFNTVILYIGGNDLSRTTDHELTEELYDQLLALIKASNPSIKTVVCKLAPRGDVDVSILNMIIDRLAAHHSWVSVVDIFSDFYDNNGNLQMRFIGQQDHVHPSPSGIKRIAGSIHRECPLVDDFTKSTYPTYRPQNNSHTNTGFIRRYPQNAQSQQRCMKCNGTNHKTFECKFKQGVKCWSCGMYGHKQETCWNAQ
jgi:lysophospholipase L1-like esterase